VPPFGFEIGLLVSGVYNRRRNNWIRAFAAQLKLLQRCIGTARKDLQPQRFEQSHAQDVLVFVTDSDVVMENSFQLQTDCSD
jgi:hypothetical protein